MVMSNLPSSTVRTINRVARTHVRQHVERLLMAGIQDNGKWLHRVQKLTDRFMSIHRFFQHLTKYPTYQRQQGNITLVAKDSASLRCPDKRWIFYCHGGAYVLGSVLMYNDVLARLAHECDVNVAAVDYRIAPRAPFPTALTDGFDAYRRFIGEIDPRRVVVQGDSAGGHMALSLGLLCEAHRVPFPRGIVAWSPWLDWREGRARISGRGGRADTRDPIISEESAAFFVTHCFRQQGRMARHQLEALGPVMVPSEGYGAISLDGTDLPSPLLAPNLAQPRRLARFPPVFFQTGADETLAVDTKTMTSKLGRAGVPVRAELYRELMHVWQLVPTRDSSESNHNLKQHLDDLFS